MDYCADLLTRTIENVVNIPPYNELSDYNIFHVLNISTREVIMCRFLADLLNPEGQHGYGILFLKAFMQEVLREKHMSDTLLLHTQVSTEYEIDQERRIDIVIQNIEFFIPIEVKIWADEQEGQCFDYYKKAKNSPIIYLTAFGNMPSEYSRKHKDSTEILPSDAIRCISWANDISQWLTGLLAQLNEPVKSTIMQYLDAIHVFADDRGTKIMNKNLEVLYKSPEYFNAGLEIEKNMKTAKANLMCLVFDDFRKMLDEIAPKYGLEPEKEFDYYIYEEKCNVKFYETNASTYPGLNYVCNNAKFKNPNLQMWFRIEVDEQLYAGFVLFNTESDSKDKTKGYEVSEITDEIAKQAEGYIDKDIISQSGWWLTWCYSNGAHQDGYYDDVPDFKHMNPCAVSLVDGQKRKAFVKNAVEVFEKQLLKHLKNI